jgi:hypothetical protein
VHPLPQTLLEFVWDFGTLPASTEQLYIKSILLQKYAGGDKSGQKSSEASSGGQGSRHPSRLLYDAREEERVIDFLTRVISVSHTFLRYASSEIVLRYFLCCYFSMLLTWLFSFSFSFEYSLILTPRNNGFTVSLRDVSRVIRLINWFTESFLNRNRETERERREGNVCSFLCYCDFIHSLDLSIYLSLSLYPSVCLFPGCCGGISA